MLNTIIWVSGPVQQKVKMTKGIYGYKAIAAKNARESLNLAIDCQPQSTTNTKKSRTKLNSSVQTLRAQSFIDFSGSPSSARLTSMPSHQHLRCLPPCQKGCQEVVRHTHCRLPPEEQKLLGRGHLRIVDRRRLIAIVRYSCFQ